MTGAVLHLMRRQRLLLRASGMAFCVSGCSVDDRELTHPAADAASDTRVDGPSNSDASATDALAADLADVQAERCTACSDSGGPTADAEPLSDAPSAASGDGPSNTVDGPSNPVDGPSNPADDASNPADDASNPADAASNPADAAIITGDGPAAVVDAGADGPTGVCPPNACVVGTTCATSTSLQTCAVQSNGCASSSTAACATDLVCERAGAAGCATPTWAQWPMPNDAVAVSGGAPNHESYTDNVDGTVTDNITGLMWQQTLTSLTFTEADAVSYCTTIGVGAHADWRLPTIIELVSLVDFAIAGTTIDPLAFPNTPAGAYWSRSALIGALGAAFYAVDFTTGGTNVVGSGVMNSVRCVR